MLYEEAMEVCSPPWETSDLAVIVSGDNKREHTTDFYYEEAASSRIKDLRAELKRFIEQRKQIRRTFFEALFSGQLGILKRTAKRKRRPRDVAPGVGVRRH